MGRISDCVTHIFNIGDGKNEDFIYAHQLKDKSLELRFDSAEADPVKVFMQDGKIWVEIRDLFGITHATKLS